MPMQQQNMNMTANRNMHSDKELHYLKDFLSWELLAVKKCKDAADACTDPQIRQMIEQTGQKHIAHYESILAELHA
ncbi:hypothetical protein FE783_27180 [Paenibacillus mesophilus]|uniref:hypothetical protein n=1 Tax=Paenibacillus mesophilus TaxID=2582849 RepID=UPI00110F1167|nr:hypothetical protein [Paenibacillus mesophilus]TMV46108.1 hypothetical protein FE783_27180 [Paenibacillus mesophilus]